MAIIQPPPFSSMLRAQDPFGPGMPTPFQRAQEMRETLGAQMASAGLGVRGRLTEVEEQGRNLLEIAELNANSAERIAKLRIEGDSLAARRQALLGLATGGGGLLNRFAGQAFQPPAAGVGGLANTVGGFNGAFQGLTDLRNISGSWATPPAAIQGPIKSALGTVPQIPSFG